MANELEDPFGTDNDMPMISSTNTLSTWRGARLAVDAQDQWINDGNTADRQKGEGRLKRSAATPPAVPFKWEGRRIRPPPPRARRRRSR